jgi:putative NIF3 family GTP cyclohydrolase 1 type 2
MLYKELKTILENEIAPKRYKKSLEFSGVQYGDINGGTLIKRLLITIDLNLNVLHFAIKNKINFVISQLPLLEKPIFKINKSLINKLNLLSRYPLCIYVLNSSYIASENGVSEIISKMLYLNIDDVLEIRDSRGKKNTIGRICIPMKYPNQGDSFLLKDLLKRIKSHFNLQIVPYVGEIEQEITKICVIPTENHGDKFINKAVENNCNTLITSNIDYKQAVIAKEAGLSLISIPYHKTSYYSLKKLYNYLSLQFPNDKFIFFDEKSPINYFIP